MADVEAGTYGDPHVRPGESFHEWASRRARERGEAMPARESEADRVGREAQRRATSYARARGRL